MLQQQAGNNQKRIESIDVLRGIVMVIMALDHVRDYFHIPANIDDPLNLETTTTILFFTRWATHFCAPAFVFLSGISIYLQSLRKTKNELSAFLIKRGCWLIFVEVAIITFGWSFNPHYNFVFLQVIWAIGISMLLMGVLTRLPFRLMLVLGLIIVLGHNFLDIPEAAAGFKAGFWWDLLHHGFFKSYEFVKGHFVFIVYPFIPWLGLMMLGYCTGVFFTEKFSALQRKKLLNISGIGLILLFILLRISNLYGDPHAWSVQKNTLFTFLSFLSVHKYPPSLLYMCITIGPALLFLSFIEHTRNGFTKIAVVFGRTAFFYYILHIYLIHLLSAICFFARGHSFQDAVNGIQSFPWYFVVPGEGYGLAVVYLVWAILVIALYPLCRWYDHYKTNHKQNRWLSYL